MQAYISGYSIQQRYQRSRPAPFPLKGSVPTQAHTSHRYAILFASESRLQVSIDGRRYELSHGQFLLVNPGKEMLGGEGAEKATMLLVDSAAICQAAGRLRHEPGKKGIPGGQEHLDLCEQVYDYQDSELGQALRKMAQGDKIQDYSWAELVVAHQQQIYQQLQRLTSAKLSTRKELYRRLCKAKRFMLQNLSAPLDLDTLSQVACLSKYHFIRLFKEVYGQTPRQYLISRRLEHASMLLKESDLTFHEICQEVGLKDSSSFGRLFKRSFGYTPHYYRRMHAVGTV